MPMQRVTVTLRKSLNEQTMRLLRLLFKHCKTNPSSWTFLLYASVCRVYLGVSLELFGVTLLRVFANLGVLKYFKTYNVYYVRGGSGASQI